MPPRKIIYFSVLEENYINKNDPKSVQEVARDILYCLLLPVIILPFFVFFCVLHLVYVSMLVKTSIFLIALHERQGDRFAELEYQGKSLLWHRLCVL